MDLYNIKSGNKLESVETDSFRLEKDIQSLVENNLNTLFGLEFVRSEFSIKNFRIDTLTFDQSNNSFVIIEYKKGKSYSVIDQGYSYLGLMLDNKSEFILEYNESNNKNLKRGDVDWTQSKVIFVSPNFSTFQRQSVNFQGLPIELFEIKKYSNRSIILQQLVGESDENISTISKGDILKEKVNRIVKVYSEDDIVLFGEKEIQNLYHELRSSIMDWGDVSITPTKKYIGFLRSRNICSMFVQKKKIKLWVNLKKGELKDNLGITRDVSHVGHHGIGDYQIHFDNSYDIDYILSLIKQSYNKQN